MGDLRRLRPALAGWLLESNAGTFGNTSRRCRDRFEPEVLGADAEAVVIMGGTNDVLQGVPTEESIAAVREMLEKAQDADVEVWLVAPPPIDDGFARSVTPLVEAERELAAELGVPFLDPSEGLADPAGGGCRACPSTACTRTPTGRGRWRTRCWPTSTDRYAP